MVSHLGKGAQGGALGHSRGAAQTHAAVPAAMTPLCGQLQCTCARSLRGQGACMCHRSTSFEQPEGTTRRHLCLAGQRGHSTFGRASGVRGPSCVRARPGHADAVAPHERAQRAVGARHGPRGDCHPDRGREAAAARARPHPPRPGCARMPLLQAQFSQGTLAVTWTLEAACEALMHTKGYGQAPGLQALQTLTGGVHLCWARIDAVGARPCGSIPVLATFRDIGSALKICSQRGCVIMILSPASLKR